LSSTTFIEHLPEKHSFLGESLSGIEIEGRASVRTMTVSINVEPTTVRGAAVEATPRPPGETVEKGRRAVTAGSPNDQRALRTT
jgi:hypothetical protein